MRIPLGPIVVLCAAGFAAMKLMDYGNSVASDAMATLNTKYVGRCIGLSDGRTATVLSVRGKNLRVTDLAMKGNGDIFSVERVPDLDRYIVDCPKAAE
jgi:hypothetical protein